MALDKTLFNAQFKATSYQRKVWRLVEDQEDAATLNIVDNMEEQELLENLLDDIKPPYRPGTEHMHYLLKTAFRYPPLKYGSRFGTRAMPSYFYASEHRKTSLAETAYYRFVFLADMQEPYHQPVDSRHSLFAVSVKTQHALNLTDKRFLDIQQQISHPSDYHLSQAIGKWATEQASIAVICFDSARDTGYNNVAIADPAAIISKQPRDLRKWLCRTTSSLISFNSREVSAPISFPIEYFTVDGNLPRPA